MLQYHWRSTLLIPRPSPLYSVSALRTPHTQYFPKFLSSRSICTSACPPVRPPPHLSSATTSDGSDAIATTGFFVTGA